MIKTRILRIKTPVRRSFFSIAALLTVSIITRADALHEKPATIKVPLTNAGELIQSEFSLRVNNLTSPYDVVSAFVLPDQPIELDIAFARKLSNYHIEGADGGAIQFKKVDEDSWLWRDRREPGIYSFTVGSSVTEHSVRLNILVKQPVSKKFQDQGEALDLGNFKIGKYPAKSEIKNKGVYISPDGFIEVTESNKKTQLSPNFTLAEFVSKQQGDYPKYVFLKERLILKLEMIKREVERKHNGKPQRVVVMSGYRTPYYNTSIGNVKFSRHVYGDAADIFIDNDRNYRMDDLNADGVSDIQDAYMLANIIEKLDKTEFYKPFIGGLGIYGPKSHRGSFVHVDTRGFMARWVKK